MKIWISNEDVTETLGRDVAVLAQQRSSTTSPKFHDARVTALSLRESTTEGEYFENFMRLLRLRHGASADAFDIPRKPGPIGAVTQMVRKLLWKIFRYQHDRMTFQQNMINEMLIHALEFEMSERRSRIDALECEVARLKGGPA
jgi:hypothetical protein